MPPKNPKHICCDILSKVIFVMGISLNENICLILSCQCEHTNVINIKLQIPTRYNIGNSFGRRSLLLSSVNSLLPFSPFVKQSKSSKVSIVKFVNSEAWGGVRRYRL